MGVFSDRNRSWPAVSQTSRRTASPSASSTRRSKKAALIVDRVSGRKASFTNRVSRDVLPTPLSPSITNLKDCTIAPGTATQRRPATARGTGPALSVDREATPERDE